MCKLKDECIGCPPELGCAGNACKYKNVPVYFCDLCGAEIEDDVYEDDDGHDLCEDCLKEMYRKDI